MAWVTAAGRGWSCGGGAALCGCEYRVIASKEQLVPPAGTFQSVSREIAREEAGRWTKLMLHQKNVHTLFFLVVGELATLVLDSSWKKNMLLRLDPK